MAMLGNVTPTNQMFGQTSSASSNNLSQTDLCSSNEVMIVKVGGLVISIINFKLQQLPLLKLVLQHKLLLPLRMKGVVNGLGPIYTDPLLALVVPDVEDTEGVTLTEHVHVCQVVST